MKLPPKIRKALASVLHDYELWGIENDMTFDEKMRCVRDDEPSEVEMEMEVLERGIRALVDGGHVEAAIKAAIIFGEWLAQDEHENSIYKVWEERGKREADAIKEAARRRWGERKD